jgi:hypothetical protein
VSQGIGVVLAGIVAQASSPALAVAAAGACGLLVTWWNLRRWHSGYTVLSMTK